jgi:cytochrome c oxidase cbb3-type subunit III
MRTNKKVFYLALCLAAFPSLVFAAGGAAAKSNDMSMPLLVLVGFSALLLCVIGVLANAKKQLSEIAREKMKAEKSGKIVSIMLFIMALSLPALHAGAAEAAPAPAAAVAAPIIAGLSDNDFYGIITVIALEFFVIFFLLYNIFVIQKMLKQKTVYNAAGAVVSAEPESNWFWDTFNKAVPIEKEQDKLMDHDYDGIRELDNSLPPWWLYGFYITIAIAAVYLYVYSFSGIGQSSKEEFESEMQKGEEETAAYMAKAGNSVDEKTVTLLTDGAALGEGKALFMKNCIPCHLADGGGLVGPNLTDDYWLHGGSIKDIFKTIKYGYMEKGMKSWKDDFSPKQIQELASYVKSLRGTKPANPKAPQGDLYVEAGAAAPAADTTKAAPAADTSKVKK